jgi:hypothetical protein
MQSWKEQKNKRGENGRMADSCSVGATLQLVHAGGPCKEVWPGSGMATSWEHKKVTVNEVKGSSYQASVHAFVECLTWFLEQGVLKRGLQNGGTEKTQVKIFPCFIPTLFSQLDSCAELNEGHSKNKMAKK